MKTEIETKVNNEIRELSVSEVSEISGARGPNGERVWITRHNGHNDLHISVGPFDVVIHGR